MEYERIEKKAQGGGFSPKKLRSMLLGSESHRKEEEELESSSFRLRSQVPDIDESGGGASDNCKDVDVVSVVPDCSTSTTADSANSEMASDRRSKNHSGVRYQEEPSSDYDIGYDNTSMTPSAIFEFQKSERASQRKSVVPFSKHAPSKWDDAQKWIASPPTSNKPKTGQAHILSGHNAGSRKMGNAANLLNRQLPAKVVEISDQKMVSIEEPDNKWIDPSHIKKENGLYQCVSWEADQYSITDSYAKSVLMIENSIGASAINLSRHNSSLAIHSATAFIPPPSTARSVSMRDMGTEMTPIASQEPSRNGTPVRATTPIRSPTSSRPSTPPRTAPASSPSNFPKEQLGPSKDFSEKELQTKTRREIMALGAQLGKVNIAAWASKDEEGRDISTSLQNSEQPVKSIIETRADTWEEAEKAKYLARFKRDEMKIQAWENHQKAKTEADMRKVEVEVESIRGRAHDKLMNKLALVRHKAEEKRAAAEAKRNRQAAKAEKQADYIRRTGRVPSFFSICSCCS